MPIIPNYAKDIGKFEGGLNQNHTGLNDIMGDIVTK